MYDVISMTTHGFAAVSSDLVTWRSALWRSSIALAVVDLLAWEEMRGT